MCLVTTVMRLILCTYRLFVYFIFRPNLFLSVPLETILQTNDKINFALIHSENSEIIYANLFRINNEMKIAAANAKSKLARGYAFFLMPSLLFQIAH